MIDFSIQQEKLAGVTLILSFLSIVIGRVLRADLLAPWVGWVSIGWSIVWLGAYVINVGFPVIIVLYPLIFGIGLLLY